MQLKETRAALNEFGKYVVQQSRSNLTKGKKNSSKRLYDSIGYTIVNENGKLSIEFEMEDYGEFQDKGVSGKKRKYNTPYSYKDKMPPPSALDKWIVRKGLKGTRDEKGKFISRKSLQFMIARSIYNNGIKPSLFFTKPFEKAFERLPKELIDKFVLDIEKEFDQ